MHDSSRLPIVPLRYEDSHKAIPKEIMINYSTGELFVMSEDGSTILSITDQIREQLKGIGSDKIIVTIPDKGEFTLTQVLDSIRKDIDLTLTAEDTGDPTLYIPREERIDGDSIESKYKRIQIRGFNKAPEMSIAVKKDKVIQWFPLDSLPNTGGGSGNNTDAIKTTKVEKIEPVNSKIYLKAMKAQRTINLSMNVEVVLPSIIDEFSEIYWMVQTFAFTPLLTFAPNIIFKYDKRGSQPTNNSVIVYKFYTWDSGKTWMAESVLYTNTPDSQTSEVTVKYLQDNYYNKNEMAGIYYTIDDIEDRYYDKYQTNARYPSKNYLELYYYNKEDVNKMLTWGKNVGSSTNVIIEHN